ELKPIIDATYRTLPDASNTALGGSSLGGLATLHLGLAHPDVFGNLAVMSPSVWWDKRAILADVDAFASPQRPRIWLDMGGREGAFLDRAELLTFEEIARLAQLFANEGIQKIRLTGGEPLLRRDLERLVGMLAATRGVQDIALTTNGSLLTREKAIALHDAG